MKVEREPTLTTEIFGSPYTSLSEERQITGRYVALGVAISLITLGLYHAWEHKIAVLAGLFVPALIMFLYILWVLYSANKDARRIRRLQAFRTASSGNLTEIICQPNSISPTTSLSKLSTTSSKCSSHQNHCHHTNLTTRNGTTKPLSKSSSKSSLISSKNTIININQPIAKKNTAKIFYPEVHKSRTNITNSKLSINETKLKENVAETPEQQLSSKYQSRLKRHFQTPVRVHVAQLPTPSVPKGLGRTYSIA